MPYFHETEEDTADDQQGAEYFGEIGQGLQFHLKFLATKRNRNFGILVSNGREM